MSHVSGILCFQCKKIRKMEFQGKKLTKYLLYSRGILIIEVF